MGIAMTLEDSWGGDIATAAIAHLAQSTPPEFLFSTTDFNSYVTVSTATGAPQRVNGRMAASSSPGLGISPRMEVLGKPVVVVEGHRKTRTQRPRKELRHGSARVPRDLNSDRRWSAAVGTSVAASSRPGRE